MNKDAEPQTKSEFIQQVYNAHTISKLSLEKLKVVILMQLNIKIIFRVSLGYTAGSKLVETGIDYFKYVVNKDNQIVFARYYINEAPYTETWRSQQEMEDGEVYSHHVNINHEKIYEGIPI